MTPARPTAVARPPGRTPTDIAVESLDAAGAGRALPQLVELLRDAVDGGASIGFLPPLASDEAEAYWQGGAAAVAAASRVLLVTRGVDGRIDGTAQLDLESRPNGRHRAEVMKVIVHTRMRRRGIGRALMAALEAEARSRRRTTLVLDTRAGDPSEQLYAACGWTRAGIIPAYARNRDGGLDSTALFYRLLA